jgi:hypothetical protein
MWSTSVVRTSAGLGAGRESAATTIGVSPCGDRRGVGRAARRELGRRDRGWGPSQSRGAQHASRGSADGSIRIDRQPISSVTGFGIIVEFQKTLRMLTLEI